jgi:sugar lactone lactonase YvrE
LPSDARLKSASDDSTVPSNSRRLSMHRSSRDRKALMGKFRRRIRPSPEVLEDRLVAAVQLTYGGPGSILSLHDLVTGPTPNVTISEPTAGQLRIDLGSNTFDGTSTTTATGLTYANAGSPATSNYATVDISQANNITTLQAALPNETLTLGPIADAAGGLSNVVLSAGFITVNGLDTSHASAGNGNVDLRATGTLAVAQNATLNTGTGTLSLSAGVNADGVGSDAGGSVTSGILTLASGSAVVSENTGVSAITLRADAMEIDTSDFPAFVGALPPAGGSTPQGVAGGVVIRTGDPELSINLGDDSGSSPGLSLSHAELAQIFTTAVGTLTFGDLTQMGTISFTSISPTVAGAEIVALQAPTGPGAIYFDSSVGGPPVNAGSGDLHMTAGTGGFRGNAPDPSIASTGHVTLDTLGSVGVRFGPVVFDAVATPSTVTIGATYAPASGVYMGGLGALTLGDIRTANSLLVVTAEADLTVGTFAVVDTGTAPVTLSAGVDYFGHETSSDSALAIAAGAAVVSSLSSTDAITLISTDIEIDTGFLAATVGLSHVVGQPPVPVAGGVVIHSPDNDQPIIVGAASGTGLVLSNAELDHIFTVAGGTLTFGDPSQKGNITFAGASWLTTAGAGVAAVQSPTGGGSIILDSTGRTALAVGSGNVQLSAGTGGIVATGSASSLATTGQVSFDTTSGIGTGISRIQFDAAATPADVTIGTTSAPAAGAYLGGLGSLTLGSVLTDDSPLDVTAASDLTVAPDVVLETGTGTLSLAAAINPDGTSATAGLLTIAAGAEVVSENTGDDAISLRGTDVNIATGKNPAIVGAHRNEFSSTPNRTLTGLANPSAMAFDAAGNLYVANSGGTTVSVFEPGQTMAKSTLTELDGPIALAFDSSGKLYVANFNGTTVSVFDPGQTTPETTLTGVSSPIDLAFDNAGNLYVVNTDKPTVSVFPPGATSPKFTLTDQGTPSFVATDADGNIYVSNFEGTVSVFAPGKTTPFRTLTGLSHPSAAVFDAAGNAYFANIGNLVAGTTVSVFAPGSTTPTSTLTGLSGPIALAFDVRGNLYVANSGGETTGTTVSVFKPGSTTPTSTLTDLNGPTALAFDTSGNLYVANSFETISVFSAPPPPVAAAGGVIIRTAQPGEPINVGASFGIGLILSDAELAQLFVSAGGALTIGDPSNTGDITVTGSVSRHTGFDTLVLQTQAGVITAASGAVLSVANLGLQAGIGIGTTGAMAIDATHLAFASQSGAIQLSDTNAVTLTSVGPISATSIPGNVFSASNVGDSFTVLHAGGGVTGQISYNGRALAQDATFTLADGNHYRIDYTANGGDDVTLTRVASLTLRTPAHPSPDPGTGSRTGSTPPAAGVALEWSTLVITGSAGDDVVRLTLHGKMLRVYANFLPAGAPFLAFRRKAVKQVLMQLGAGNDQASVARALRLPVVIVGGAGDDKLTAGGGRSLLIGGPGRDVLSAAQSRQSGSILIGGSTSFDANDAALSAILAEWSSSRPRNTRIANIKSGCGSRRLLNGDAFLTPITLVDDGARDVLSGNPKRDWFLPGTGDAVVSGVNSKYV